MAFNGAGVFQRIYNWVTDAANSINITDTRMDAEMDGFATGLSTCITKDGQTTITANLPMATFRHTGVGNATARTDYAAAGQVQDSSFTWCGTAGGTKNALTLTPTPAITAYATGQEFVFKAGATSSDDAVTISISGLTTKAAQLNDTACSASVYIEANKYYRAIYDGTAIQLTRLSTFISPFAQTLIDDASAADVRTTIGLAKGVAAGNVLQADQPETSVASASSITLATTLNHLLTGTSNVDTINSVAGRTNRIRVETGTFALIHSAGLNCLQTGATITTRPGDTFDWFALTESTGIVMNYMRADGSPVSMGVITSSLVANVLLNNTANYFDGPTVSQGNVGKWFASGTVTVYDSAGTATIMAKLWDGTTLIASTVQEVSVANKNVSISLSGFIDSPAGNIRISARDVTSANGIMAYAQGNAKDSTLTAIRIG